MKKANGWGGVIEGEREGQVATGVRRIAQKQELVQDRDVCARNMCCPSIGGEMIALGADLVLQLPVWVRSKSARKCDGCLRSTSLYAIRYART